MSVRNLPDAADARLLERRQLAGWPLARQHFEALAQVETRRFLVNGREIVVQFNPARIRSSAAKVDSGSLRARPCFLCAANLPAEQLRLPMGARYLLLTNPYPIFREHFTLPATEHAPQRIAGRIDDLLTLTRALAPFTLFYNGPACGASAPDHAHFQAVTPGAMPLDRDLPRLWAEAPLLRQIPGGSLRLLLGYLRNGFLIRAATVPAARTLFRLLYAALPLPAGEVEPRMNLFCYRLAEEWILVVVPRRRHRPWQYDAEGAERFISSPGAADIGGLFITARREDFDKVSAALLQDLYEQVCLDDGEIRALADKIAR